MDRVYLFFFQLKTAYGMRSSDWSSDGCSSDLEAMLTKDPAPENLENEEGGDGEISEKNAGVSFKDEDEVEEEPEADADGEEGDAAKKRENFEEDEEDNTLSLAAMEELLKPDALERLAAIRSEERRVGKECVSTCG